ncbi:MAG TPA: nucleotidyltransferase family protein [Chloroflexota bacterium]|nr:nucleotidyltransferase family protein [Chloroflexota bacterium]
MVLSAIERDLLAACRGERIDLRSCNLTALLDLATAHGVWPLVVSNLMHGSDPSCDRASDQRALSGFLEQLHAQALIHQRLTIEELNRVIELLRPIETMVLKGPVFAQLYYPPGARVARDIDVAIRKPDYELARNRLLQLGYRPIAGYDEKLQRRRARDMGFLRTDVDGLTWSVELHWRLAEIGATHLDEQAIWDGADTLRLADTMWIRTPNLRDTLLLLAVSFRKHRFARLKAVCDLARLLELKAGSIDWELVHADAHRAGVCVALRHALHLSESLLGAPPSPYPECLRSRGVQSRALRRLVGDEAVLADGRPGSTYQQVAGILPFVSVDTIGTGFKLAAARVSLSPELASYHAGAPGAYRNRIQYLRDTGLRAYRALRLMTKSSPYPLSGQLRPDAERHTMEDVTGSEEAARPV